MVSLSKRSKKYYVVTSIASSPKPTVKWFYKYENAEKHYEQIISMAEGLKRWVK